MKLYEQLTIELLLNYFKEHIIQEPFITYEEKKTMVKEIEDTITFENKIKLMNTYKFMQPVIKTALEKIGYVYGG